MITEPLSPVEIEVKMAQCIEAIKDAVNVQRDLGLEAAVANHAYRQAQAKCWLISRQDPELKTDKLREVWVVRETSDDMWLRDKTKAKHDAQRSLVHSLQTQAELLRSLARSSRDLVDSWGSGR